MKVSPHFSLSEFAQPARHGQPACEYPFYWVTDPTRLPALVDALEGIRAIWNRPITILSGYRSTAYNDALYKAEGRAPTLSQHTQGRAADIRVLDIPVKEVHDKILAAYLAGKFVINGLGYYPTQNFVHVDVRVGWTHLARWTG